MHFGLTANRQCRTWIDAALGLVFPEVCQICGKSRASPSQGFVCDDCRAEVHFIKEPMCLKCGRPFQGAMDSPPQCGRCRERPLHFEFARSAVTARGPVLEAIHHYKYDGTMCVEPFLSGLLVASAAAELSSAQWHSIVPVPLHPVKEREREFNQAFRLAKHLGEATHIPVNPRVLRRIRPTPSQTRLHRDERWENMRGAFALRHGAVVKGQCIILLDDVFTTGATTDACARILRQAGADRVCVWTLARGI